MEFKVGRANGYSAERMALSEPGVAIWTAIIALLCCLGCDKSTSDSGIRLPENISFNFDIRPILSNNCYVCHGPDSSTRQADLRLDLREYATQKLADGNRAIVPGNWKKSALIHRVSSSDPEVMMPPPEMKRTLSPREIVLLKRWIDDGAPWEPYWAFMPPSEPAVPEVSDYRYVDNGIDNFIVHKLESRQLTPAQQAGKSSLVRRLSYTLTGLPPNPQEVRTFKQNETPDAYEQLVDYYLESPRFGEHWARHWMDLIRYADTRGHEFDYAIIGAWRYRDYLIRAFNEDIPYDLLIKEHLAGDLLNSPRLNKQEGFNESVIGTAFFCLTEGKHSPVDLRIDQAERIDNIIDVTSKTFQALTVACAKCHDHKFDPIPTTDYYSMYGMIESTRFTLTPTGFNRQRRLILDSLLEDQLNIREYIVNNLQQEPLSTVRLTRQEINNTPYNVIGDFRDGSLDGWIPDGISMTNALGYPIIDGKRLIGVESGKASGKASGEGLFGVLRSPGFVISEDSMLFQAAGKNSVIRVIIDNFQLIQDPIYRQLQTHIKSDELQDYRIDLSMWKGHRAYVELLVGDYMRRKDKGFHEYDLDPEAWLEVEYVLGFDSMTTGIPEIKYPLSSAPIEDLLKKWAAGEMDVGEVMALNQWLSENKPTIPGIEEWKEDQERRARLLYDSSFVVGVTDGDHIQSPVFIRGSSKNLSKDKVPHRFLTAVSDTTQVFRKSNSGRLEFANKIADPGNPLTARVMVNRIWHHVFGKGIVETVDNFGVQGKIPSHPDLLDHLAQRFMENGWSIKKIIKYMVMSQAFQRVTDASDAASVVDPDNLLLQHYPVRRITAESIRDAVLATSGRLDTAMYGPPVPMYLTEFLGGRGRPQESGPLDGAGRRSIYQALNRNFLPPMMLAFDLPIPFSTFGRRNVSNVPSQSLTMLNDPFIEEQASLWADKLLGVDKDFEKRIGTIYLQAFSREPESHEIEQARKFFEEQSALLDPSVEEAEIEKELWKSYCHSIYNMKEFIFLI